MPVRIGPMKGSSVDDLLDMERECFPKVLSPDDLYRGIGQGLSFTAENDLGLVGYLLCEKILDECHIVRIAVKEGIRGQGLGARLMEELFEKAKSSGITKFYLEVRASNSAARSFYLKMGFKESYTRKKYYTDNLEDAIFMEKIQGTCE